MSTEPNTESTIENRENRIATDREVRAAWLTPRHFKAGQSGNPGVRPKKRPVAEALAWAGELPCPSTRRRKLEKKLGVELPQSLTLAQAMAIGQFMRAVNDTNCAKWIAAELRLGATPDSEPLVVPDITFQFVEVSTDGTPVRIVDLEAPPPMGEEPHKAVTPTSVPSPPRGETQSKRDPRMHW